MPWKNLVTAYTLSRAPAHKTTHPKNQIEEQLIEGILHTVLSARPITEKRLQELQMAKEADEVLGKVKQYCLYG